MVDLGARASRLTIQTQLFRLGTSTRQRKVRPYSATLMSTSAGPLHRCQELFPPMEQRSL